jgi:prepilin-type N-terminal cleavage/methylation domain-containing protein
LQLDHVCQEKLMNTPNDNRRGFTIVEMLVVIGIITVLIALLLPALSGVQNRARKNTELSHLRQIHIAWMAYANNNNDAALPGYLDEDVQERWRIRIQFPYDPEDVDEDGPSGPGDPGTNGSAAIAGSSHGAHASLARQTGPSTPNGTDETGATWTWRLMPYFDYAYDIVLGYDDEADRTTRNLVARRQFVANHPAFGYNGLYVGGRWRMLEGRPQHYFTNARSIPADGSTLDGSRVSVVARTVAQIQRSSEVIIFCSSTRIPAPQIVNRVTDIDPGYHMVTPPWVAEDHQWGHADDDVGQGDLRLITAFATPSLVPIGRYNRLVPYIRVDGSTGTQLPTALLDLRNWLDAARSPDFRHTRENDEANFAQFP